MRNDSALKKEKKKKRRDERAIMPEHIMPMGIIHLHETKFDLVSETTCFMPKSWPFLRKTRVQRLTVVIIITSSPGDDNQMSPALFQKGSHYGQLDER